MEEVEDPSTLLLKQFAFEKGLRVFKGVTEVFPKPEQSYEFDFSPNETTFTVNPSIGNVTRIRTLDPLKKIGYAIVTVEAKTPWFPGQQVEYKLVPYRPGLLNKLDRIPTINDRGLGRCTVEIDSTGRIRLSGRNAGPNMYGPWIQTKTKRSVVTKSYRPLNVGDYLNRPDDTLQNTIRELSKNINEEEDIVIPPDEIPIMITEENELLCIKLEKDIFHVGAVGKTGCIPKCQEVLIKRNGLIQKALIGDVYIKDEIACEHEGKIVFKPVLATFDKGSQLTIQIETRMGAFECTTDHELLTVDEWGRIIKKRAETFSSGDILVYANALPHQETITTIPIELVKHDRKKYAVDTPLNRTSGFLMGMYLAEGIATYGCTVITNSHPKLLASLESACKTLGLSYRISHPKDRASFISLRNGVHHWFKAQFNSGSANKSIPSWVYSSPREFQEGLIDGYLSGDGYVDTAGRVYFTTKSLKLWEGMQALLLQREIRMYQIKKRNLKYGTYYEGLVDMSFNHKLPHLSHPEKQARVKQPTAHPSMYNILPVESKRIGEIIRKYSLMTGHIPNSLNMALAGMQALGRRKKSMGKPRAEASLRIIRNALPYSPYPEHYLDALEKLVHSDLGFARITTITPQQKKEVCDITVGDAHNFVLLGRAGGVIVGNSGKTLIIHSFIDRVFWHTDNKIAILNDSVNQCFTWRRPDTTPQWTSILNRYNEIPRGLPVAIFVPNHKNIVDIPFENELAFREAISWEWMVQNWKTFLDGSPWELGATEKYFNRYKKEFLQMYKLEELQEYFYGKVGTKEMQANSADKINATLADMWAKEFIDRSTKITSRWNFQTPSEHYEEDPFVGCLRAGLIPVLNTVNLKDQHYHPQYTKYKIDQVKHYQLSIPTNKRKKMWLFVDEIGDIYKKGNEKTVAGRKLVETVTQGRNFQLGCLYTIQNYTQIDPEIRNNTGYFFCFTMSSIEEGRAIAKNLGLEKGIGESLTTLQKGQCIAITNDREWVLYTPYGERYRATGAFKGDPLPPLSMHYRPGDEL